MVLAGAAVIAIAARLALTLPGTPVPQTAQTLAVVLVGGLLGPSAGALAALSYVGLGVVGVPVFAGGEAGLDRLIGPTGGYLLGFVLAAAIAGWWMASGRCARMASAVGGMALAHILILAVGWGWLSLQIGAVEAFGGGVGPFLLGAVVKSVLAGVALAWVAGSRSRATRSDSATCAGPGS